jgi:hypothetical protein
MTLNIHNDSISSDRTSYTARLLPGDQAFWEVSWLPDHPMDRHTAHVAMALADMTRYDEQAGHRLTVDIIDMAAKIGGAAPDAHSPAPASAARTDAGKSGQPSDPEAGG